MIDQYVNSITKNSVALHLAFDEIIGGFVFIVAVIDNDTYTYEETKYKATDYRSAIKQFDETKEKFMYRHSTKTNKDYQINQMMDSL